jgi:hypothetical protein
MKHQEGLEKRERKTSKADCFKTEVKNYYAVQSLS